MTLIRCTSNCIYQKEGYCTNQEQKIPGGTINLKLSDGCLYYCENQERGKCASSTFAEC